MFYKYNSVSGRVAPTTQSGAYSPQGISPLQDRPFSFQFDSKTTKAAVAETPLGTYNMAQMGTSSSASGGKPLGFIPSDPAYQRVIELQKLFTKDDGVLVWMKRGPRDKVMLGLTAAGCVLGLGAAANQLYTWARKK